MEATKGSYVGARFSNLTKKMLESYIHKCGIPNPLEEKDFHTTIIYSRKNIGNKFKPLGRFSVPIVGFGKELDIWESQDGAKCLVYIYDCPDLTARHTFIMDTTGATYDYPKYIPHVTLSYDVGNLKVEDLPNILVFIPELEIVEEYYQPLDPNWTRGKTK